MRAILTVVIFIFLSACATTHNTRSNPTITDWRGQPADLLLQQKGTPSSITPAENGNTLFTYTTEIHQTYPTMMSNPTAMVGPKGTAIAASIPPSSMNTQSISLLKCSTTYEINKQHIVVSVESHGPQCD